MTTKGKSPIGRASYPHLFQPQVDKKDAAKKTYSVTLLFNKTDDLSVLEDAVEAATLERWPNKRPKTLRSPFRDGDAKDSPEYAGKVYVAFRAQEDRKPGVVDGALEEITQQSGQFYSGCFARVSFSAYTYETDGNVGVAFGLNNVQKIKDGDRFDGRTDAGDDFDAVEDPKTNKAMF